MKIRDLYAPGRRVFSFEFFPPKTDKGAQTLQRTIQELRDLAPGFVSVTYGAGGSTRDLHHRSGDPHPEAGRAHRHGPPDLRGGRAGRRSPACSTGW